MEKQIMNEKESLAIITGMLQETREYIHKGVGNIQLVWGYLSVIISLCIYFGLQATSNPWVMMGWWLIPLIGWPVIYRMKRRNPQKIVTIFDKMIKKVWIVIGITATAAPLLMASNTNDILFIEAILISIGITITGLIINFKTLYIPGFVCIGISFLLLWFNGINQILIFALLFLVMLIIPGHIINHQANKKISASLCSEN